MITLAASLVAVLAPVPPQPPVTRYGGWSLTLSTEKPIDYLIPGESLGRVGVRLLLTNHSTEERSHKPLKWPHSVGVLDVLAVQGDALARQSFALAMLPFPPHPLIPDRLAPGKTSTGTFPLEIFHYSRLDRAGKVEVTVTFRTEQAVVKALPLSIDVIDVGPRGVKLSKTVDLAERKQQTDGTAYHVVVQVVEIGPDRWLVYRTFLGPAYGGGIALTERLADAKDITDFDVTGAYGDAKPLTVTYVTRTGEKIALQVHPVDGLVIGKKVIKN